MTRFGLLLSPGSSFVVLVWCVHVLLLESQAAGENSGSYSSDESSSIQEPTSIASLTVVLSRCTIVPLGGNKSDNFQPPPTSVQSLTKRVLKRTFIAAEAGRAASLHPFVYLSWAHLQTKPCSHVFQALVYDTAGSCCRASSALVTCVPGTSAGTFHGCLDRPWGSRLQLRDVCDAGREVSHVCRINTALHVLTLTITWCARHLRDPNEGLAQTRLAGTKLLKDAPGPHPAASTARFPMPCGCPITGMRSANKVTHT